MPLNGVINITIDVFTTHNHTNGHCEKVMGNGIRGVILQAALKIDPLVRFWLLDCY